jgi:histidinol-phosphate aminotransferase
VRHFNAPRISDYLRITVGTPAQMGIFLDTVQRILEQADKQA